MMLFVAAGGNLVYSAPTSRYDVVCGSGWEPGVLGADVTV